MKKKLFLATLIFFTVIGVYYFFNMSASQDLNTVNITNGDLPPPEPSLLQPINNKIIKTLPNINCHDLVKDLAPNIHWKNQTRKFIQTYIKNLEIKGVDEYILDEVAKRAGIGVFRGRVYRGFNNSFYSKPYYSESIITHIDSKVEEKILDALNSKNKVDNINNILKNIDVKDKYFLNKGQPKFLVSLAAEHLNVELLEYLLDFGVPIEYADLAELTTLDLPISILEKFHRESGLSASEILKGAFRYTSLAMIALESNKYELAKYWIEQGSSLQPDTHNYNALDLLISVKRDLSDDTFLDLFDIITQRIQLPYAKNTQEELKKILRNNNLKKFTNRFLSNTPNSTNSKRELTVKYNVDYLHKSILKKILYDDTEIQKEHACFPILGQIYTNLALDNPKSHIETAKEIETTKQKKEALIKEVEEAKLIFSTNKQVEEFLGEERSYRSKKMVQLHRVMQVQEVSKRVNDIDIDIELLNLINKVILLATQERWNKALQLLETTNSKSDEIYSTLLYIAINQNASFDVIEELLQNNGKMAPNTISTLIKTKNIALATQLIPYGLDINYTDILGYSSTAQAVKYESFDMLNFLFKHKVSVDTYLIGYDALDIALLELKNKTSMLPYISTLIDNGYVVGLSHLQIVAELKENNSNNYINLVNKHPMFEL
ncbi:hypothetical protein [Colwellia sp. UCD-KL20]|uniref:hypothetical protein n=1 Tax=Colwellia sp. UCD-KL20 TaxID=1917165 RepID=UPI0009710CBD|nr:hypothetical protein [Colwellia sp. UCD-KL20]